MAIDEKRVAARREIDVVVTMGSQSKLQDFYARNISGGGIFLEMENYPPLGDSVELSFAIPGHSDPLHVKAKVVRHHEIPETLDEDLQPKVVKGVGLQFVEVSDEAQKMIDQYVSGKGLSIQG